MSDKDDIEKRLRSVPYGYVAIHKWHVWLIFFAGFVIGWGFAGHF